MAELFLQGDTLLETERGGEFFLPDVLSDYEATQCVEELSKHEYGGEFNPEPCRVSQVIKDLVRYSDMGDEDFDALRNEPFAEILMALFEQCRTTSDIVGLMSEFFDTHLGRTL